LSYMLTRLNELGS